MIPDPINGKAQHEIPPAVERDDRSTTHTQRTVACPHCGESMVVEFSLDIFRVRSPRPLKTADPVDAWRKTLTLEQHALLDAAKRCGLFDAFEWAAKSSPLANAPKNIEKFLIEWFRLSKAKTIPLYLLNEFKALYPGKLIDFYAHMHVGAVIASGNVSLFLPLNIVTGQKATGADGKAKTIPPDVKGIRQWARTKMGYIPLEGRVTLQLMRKRCIGEFARPLI